MEQWHFYLAKEDLIRERELFKSQFFTNTDFNMKVFIDLVLKFFFFLNVPGDTILST